MKKNDKDSKVDQNEENEPVADKEAKDTAKNNKEKEAEESSDKTPELSNEEKLQAELADSKDKYLRLYSEFENYRRRTAKASCCQVWRFTLRLPMARTSRKL